MALPQPRLRADLSVCPSGLDWAGVVFRFAHHGWTRSGPSGEQNDHSFDHSTTFVSVHMISHILKSMIGPRLVWMHRYQGLNLVMCEFLSIPFLFCHGILGRRPILLQPGLRNSSSNTSVLVERSESCQSVFSGRPLRWRGNTRGYGPTKMDDH